MKKNKKIWGNGFRIIISIFLILLLINTLLLWQILKINKKQLRYQEYYFNLSQNLDHESRKMICDTHENLVYIKSLQTHKGIVTCCELKKEHGVDHISYCEDILS